MIFYSFLVSKITHLDYTASDQTEVIQMSRLHYTPKHCHLQLSMAEMRQICQELYMSVAPAECRYRKNIGKCKVSDVLILTMMLFQVELGLNLRESFTVFISFYRVPHS